VVVLLQAYQPEVMISPDSCHTIVTPAFQHLHAIGHIRLEMVPIQGGQICISEDLVPIPVDLLDALMSSICLQILQLRARAQLLDEVVHLPHMFNQSSPAASKPEWFHLTSSDRRTGLPSRSSCADLLIFNTSNSVSLWSGRAGIRLLLIWSDSTRGSLAPAIGRTVISAVGTRLRGCESFCLDLAL
jgi:hypothetical protein